MTGRERLQAITCDPERCQSSGTRTFYVHLLDGTVEAVSEVSNLEVTDRMVILKRGRKRAIEYPRSRIYFACCDNDCHPSRD